MEHIHAWKQIRTKMQMHVIVVTPEMAKEWLDNKLPKQRRIRETVARRYARHIKDNKWHLTHQGVAFNTDGQLMDGQHRLRAVILANTAVAMPVFTNVPDEAFTGIDIGSRRTASEVTGLNKHDVAIANALCGWVRGLRVMLSPDEIQETIDLYSEAIAFARDNLIGTSKVSKISTSLLAAEVAKAYLAGEDEERLAAFCRVLRTGVMESSDDAVGVRLRNLVLLSGRNNHAFLRKVQRGIQAFCQRENLSKLYDPETPIYPTPQLSTPLERDLVE